jgi:hypothetical protein
MVLAADMDRDSDLDIVSSAENTSSTNFSWRISWYESTKVNSVVSFFKDLVRSGDSESNLTDRNFSIVASDVDGDGDNDIVAASARDGTIVWYLNNAGDTDLDGVIDSLDSDDDNDGVADSDDDFPLDSSESVDTDDDGTGNVADMDDDDDGVADSEDAFPLDSAESLDTDEDGIGNVADTDDDNDGVEDDSDTNPLDSSLYDDEDDDGLNSDADNCPSTSNADQADADNNGVGDACGESDQDNDRCYRFSRRLSNGPY